MIIPQLKNTIRIFFKNRGITAVMITSLVIGFTTVFLLMGFIINEYSIDSFHKNKNQIVRIMSDDLWMPGQKMTHITFASPLYIKNHFPGVKDFCQWNKAGYDKIIANNKNYFNDIKVFETANSFLDIFSFNIIEGLANNALSGKNNVVLTKKTAQVFFGEGPYLGKSITIKKGEEEISCIVSAVIEPSGRSHLEFDILTSIEGKEYRGTEAYLLLDDKTDKVGLEKKLNEAKDEIPFFKEGTTVNYYLQSLDEINITDEVESKIYISLAIAVTVLFIAFLNYINLFINHIFDREKEFSVRKIIGASIMHMVNNLASLFFFEIVIAVAFSIPLLKFILPVFNQLNGSELYFSDYFHTYVLISALLVMLSIIILSYLFVFLFVKKPFRFANSHRGLVFNSNKGKIFLVNTFQYAISIVLIISAIVIYKQMNYIEHKNIGLNRDVIEFRLPAPFAEKSEAMKNSLLDDPMVESVSVCSSSPVRAAAMINFEYDDSGEKKEYTCLFFEGDDNYIKTLGFNIIQGTEYSMSNAQNSNLCYVNKTLVDFFNMKEPVGKLVPGSANQIIGVVSDFHWTGLEHKVEPGMISIKKGGRNILLKMKDGYQQTGIALINNTWKKMIPDYPLEYFTIGGLFNEKHAKYKMLAEFISFFCIISVILSSLGLIALSSFTIRRRIKEIGIRKINGAKKMEILILINKKLSLCIGLGFIVACPTGWYYMHKWLENFTYKTELNWWIFVMAGVITILIALLTVSWQTLNAARRNPVEALRYE